MTGRAPLALARAGVALAARLLPAPAARARYRAEWLAELHGLPPVRQLTYTAGLLAGAPLLRAVLEEEVMPLLGPRGPLWRCRVFRWHDFAMRSNPDGGRYQACRRCGEDRGPAGYGPMTTTPYPVGSAGA